MLRHALQASAGFITANQNAELFHLTPAQQMVFANESGPDASPMFTAGIYGGICSSLALLPLLHLPGHKKQLELGVFLMLYEIKHCASQPCPTDSECGT